MLSMLSWLISFIYTSKTHTNDESINEIDETKDSITVESKDILDNNGDIVEHFTKKTEDFYIINNDYIDTVNDIVNTTKIDAIKTIENKDNCVNVEKSENNMGNNQIEKITSPPDAIVQDNTISADNNISSPSSSSQKSSIEERNSISSEDIHPEKINKRKRKRKRNKNKNKNKQRKNRKKYKKKL